MDLLVLMKCTYMCVNAGARMRKIHQIKDLDSIIRD